MFYCEVMEEDKVSDGGGVGGWYSFFFQLIPWDWRNASLDEIIDVVEMSIQEAKDMVTAGGNNISPPNCLMGVLWFLRNKAAR